MREGWRILTLGDICKFENGDRGKNYPGRKAFTSSGVPFINAGHLNDGLIDWGSMNFIPEEHFQRIGNGKIKIGDLLFCLRGSLGKFGVVEREIKGAIASSLVIIRPTDDLYPGYLAAYFRSNICSNMIDRYSNGAAQPNLSAKCLKSFEIPLPPFPEQKRIVAILDEAFAGIDTAIANTEKNLANARELFESYLNSVFTRKGSGWKDVKIGDIAKVKGGKRVPKGYKLQREQTKYPYISVSDFNDTGSVTLEKIKFISEDIYQQISRYTISSKDLYISIAGTIGKSGIIPEELEGANLTENACKLVLDKEISNRYLYFFTRTASFKEQALKNTRTAAQPKLALERLKTIRLSIPSFETQEKLVGQFDDLWGQSQNLESIYNQKLTSLAELKQSLLKKAFSGELTADNVVPITSAKKSSAPPTTDSPAFAAHIMAVAYHWHESRGKNKTFGHVKAQKTLHLLEALAQIDLGRALVKDAAGPNDFAHMRTAEAWARENDYYGFVQRPEGKRGYDFVKGKRYSEWLARALDAVEPHKNALERVVNLLMPLDTQKAELVATVYAAWNNLLLDGHKPTEAEIVYEARDNWHPDKQQYTREQFHDAIDRLRSHGMVPTGTGKRVTGQESFEL